MASIVAPVPVLGWVVSVQSGPYEKPVRFTLRTRVETKEQDFHCSCPFFCPVQESDCVYGYVRLYGADNLVYTSQPFVQIPVGEENVKVCFIRALHGSSFGKLSADALYKRLADLAKIAQSYKKRKPLPLTDGKTEAEIVADISTDPDGVITYLSDIAARYDRNADRKFVETLTKGLSLTDVQIEALLRWWHKNRSLRRLYLFGLTNTEIKECHKPLDEIYTICMINPYKLPAIPLDKAENIMYSMRETPTAIQILQGKIVRRIYERLCKSGWTGTPLWKLASQFSTFHVLRETLVSDYDVVIEHNLAYLLYPNVVEKYVANYIDERIKSTARNFAAHTASDPGVAECTSSVEVPLVEGTLLTLPLPTEDDVPPALPVPRRGDDKPPTSDIALTKPWGSDDIPPISVLPDAKTSEEAKVFKTLPRMDTLEIESAMYACKTLTQEQKLAIQGALEHDICIIRGPAGTGKCLRPDTKVLTAYGGKAMAKDVKVGDYLIDDNSQPRRVLSICSGTDDMFRITPIKGRPFECNAPHVLTLNGITPHLEINKRKKSSYIIRYSVDGHTKTKAHSTEEEARTFMSTLKEDIFDIALNEYMKQSKTFKRCTYLFHVGVNFRETKVPIDPWMIGYWLGDGTSSGTQITTADTEVVAEYQTKLPAYGLALSEHKAKYQYGIVGDESNYGKKDGNVFLNTLRDLNMLNNKHIPDIYRLNSREVRLGILAGLIDSDGYSMHNCLEISQKSTQLADDIEYLAFSLGFMVTRTLDVKGCMYKGEMKEGEYHRLFISGSGLEQIPTILARKKCTVREQKKRATCMSFTVEALGKGAYCGWTLDGNGRFLLEDFLVTHNTSVSRELVRNLEIREIPFMVVAFTGKAVARSNEVLKRKLARTMDRCIARALSIPEFKHLIIDEFSMVSTELFYRFIRAFPGKYKITFVGDSNQLQPIQWGSIMKQLLITGRVPTYTLTINHRIVLHDLHSVGPSATLEGKAPGEIVFDRILLENANALVDPNRDLEHGFEYKSGTGFYELDGDHNYVHVIVKSLHDAGIDKSRVTVLCPYNEPLGKLNSIFQTIYLSEAKRMVDQNKKLWCVGDRVSSLCNNYNIDVMNGEEGLVTDVLEKGVEVQFADGVKHLYKYASKKPWKTVGVALSGDVPDEDDDLCIDQLIHSFALSIHRSQGSEYEYVILYIPLIPNTKGFVSDFLNISLLYTGITRSKRACWLVGDKKTIQDASCMKAPHRFENLALRLGATADVALEASLVSVVPKSTTKAVEVIADDELPQMEDFGEYPAD